MSMRSAMRSLLALALALLCAQPPAFTQAPLKDRSETGQIVARLERVIPRLLDEGMVPGLSIALIKEGELAWHRGFGLSNAQSKAPVGEKTVFEAASLSKPVFAYAALKLRDAGRLDLDTPLVKYLPGNYDVGNDARLSLITARHVLSHTTGFPNWRRRGGPLTIHFTPGDRFSYSGEGFVYLAKAVERVTGEKFDDFMRRTVFEPLGMTMSSFVWRSDYETHATFRHNIAGEAAAPNRITSANAAASLLTTAEDYGRFISAILEGTGLRRETRREMLTPQTKLSESGTNNTARAPEKLSPSLSWGLGWGLQTTDDGLAFWHWGDNGNAKAYVVVYEKKRFGVVIFANSSSGLSIVPEIVAEAVGGAQPALAWLKYESYRSPSMTLFRAILEKGATIALRDYRAAAKSGEVLDERQMNRLGHNLLAARRVKDAIEVFKLNVENHPRSANVYDSLGEAYMIAGERELAIENYERSIELAPQNEGGREALRKLRSQQ